MNFVNETITTAKAQQYLNTSLGNRPISKPTVRSYADSMKQGKWMLNGDTITFDVDGHLIDGHHRLNAVIMAEVPVVMSVCRGVDADAFKTKDDGLHRRLSQLIGMQKVKNYNAVAAAVLANDVLIKYGKIFDSNNKGNKGKRRSNIDSYDLYSKDPEGFQYSAEYACEKYRCANILLASWIGGLHYYLTHTGCYEKEFVENFFNNLCSLDASDIVPVDLLRKRLVKEKMSGTKLKPDMLFALICKTWNFYVGGVDARKIVYDPDAEKEYPTLKLNV